MERSNSWGKIHRSVFSIGLSTGAIALYAALASHANENGEAWPSRDRLMQMCGFGSKATFTEKLHELERAGVVTVTRGGQKRGGVYTTSRYALKPPPAVDDK